MCFVACRLETSIAGCCIRRGGGIAGDCKSSCPRPAAGGCAGEARTRENPVACEVVRTTTTRHLNFKPLHRVVCKGIATSVMQVETGTASGSSARNVTPGSVFNSRQAVLCLKEKEKKLLCGSVIPKKKCFVMIPG